MTVQCYLKPIDDDLLSGLISNIVTLVNDLAMYLPRVEHYVSATFSECGNMTNSVRETSYTTKSRILRRTLLMATTQIL